MSEILDSIQNKYSEEVGVVFTFFEFLVFLIFLITSYTFFHDQTEGIWSSIIFKSLDDILLADNAIINKARILDFIISGVLTFSIIGLNKKISLRAYLYLASLKNMQEYVEKLEAKYKFEDSDSNAMRIYIANVAKDQKDLHLKKISSIKGAGLVAFAILCSSIIGLFSPNTIDFFIFLSGIIIYLLTQWFAYTAYTSQVVPRLVLERMARAEKFKFGDEFKK